MINRRQNTSSHKIWGVGLLIPLMAGIIFVTGCTATDSKKSVENTLKPKVTIVQTKADNQLPEGEECTAASPTKGILNTESRMYKTIDIKKGAHFIEEKATFQKEDTIVTVNHGGCAHFGESYTFDIRHDGAVKNHEMFLDVVLKHLQSLDVLEGQHNNISTIQKVVAKHRTSSENVEPCEFEDIEGYSSVRCSFQRTNKERVRLKISYSIVL